MPFQDGNTPIGRMVITDSAGTPTEIDIARIGTTPVFPDTVGAPILETLSLSTGSLTGNGGDVTLTITGTEGAQFTLDVTTGDVSPSSGTIDSSESTTATWTLPISTSSGSLTHTATATPVGITEPGDALTPVTLIQSALPASTVTSTGIVDNPPGSGNGVNYGFFGPDQEIQINAGTFSGVDGHTFTASGPGFTFIDFVNSTAGTIGHTNITSNGEQWGIRFMVGDNAPGTSQGHQVILRATKTGERDFTDTLGTYGLSG